jgi:Isocitrate/isopropylmalate dehydrogenase
MLRPCKSSDGLREDSACKYKYMHVYVLLCYYHCYAFTIITIIIIITIMIVTVIIIVTTKVILIVTIIVMVSRAAHNYDGDMLTDEVAQVHRSPGFITSALLGKTDDNIAIKEFEASHGTVADLWHAHNRGEETSMNPLGMVSEYYSTPHTIEPPLIRAAHSTLYLTLHFNPSCLTVIFMIQYTSLPPIEWFLLPNDLLFLFYFNFCFSMLNLFLLNSIFTSFQSLLLSSQLHSSPLFSSPLPPLLSSIPHLLSTSLLTSPLLLHHSSPLLGRCFDLRYESLS